MTLRLERKEEFNAGIRRLLLEECRLAINAIEGAEDDEQRHEAVHETRKSLKKARAVVRLVRDHINDYKELNRFFRDLGRKISDIRDATASIETLDDLRDHYDSRLYVDAFEKPRKQLLHRRDALAREQFHEEDRLREIRLELEKFADKIPDLPWSVESFQDIRPSIKRVYRRGRKCWKAARESKSVKDFHEWRKRIKYLRYQVDVLHPVWPAHMSTLEDELHTLSDLAGDLHDVAVLQEAVEELDLEFSSSYERELFDAITGESMSRLADATISHGARLYHVKPGAFCDALECYWAASSEAGSQEH